MSLVIGPDVSFYDDDTGTPQGIDFVRMKQVAGFVIVRAGQNLLPDPVFNASWRAAKEAEFPRGSYWFYDSRADPKRQAELWVQQLGGDLGELPLFADIEETYNGPFKGWQNWYNFLERLKILVGKKEIGIYTAFFYWRDNAPNPKTDASSLEYFHQYPLWIANYGVMKPSVPQPWGENEWSFWQYTDTGNGRNYGAESNAIDLNYFNGDAEAFAARFKLPPPVEPPPPPPGTGRLYRVIASTLNVRVGPDTSYRSLGLLNKGEVVEEISTNADGTWIQIRRDSDGFTGWSSAKYLVFAGTKPPPTPPPPPGTGTMYRVTVPSLNVREGPSTSYQSVGHLNQGEVVEELSISPDGSWLQIRRNSDGLTGWSSARYLVVVTNEPPSPPPPPGTGMMYRVTAKALNVREGPNTSSESIGHLTQGEIVEKLSTNADGSWIQIHSDSEGLTGWSYARYLLPIENTLLLAKSSRINKKNKPSEGARKKSGKGHKR